MKKVKKLLSWLDIHGLFILSAFLIAFIPLFPKIPIFDVLPGYIVRARAEDVLIFITAIVWIKDALKGRFKIKTAYLWLVILYTLSGITSIFLGTVLLNSIPAQLLHIGKSSLHLFRYLEYFALFFFTYSSVKTVKQLKIVLSILTFTVLAIVLYGFGQEYLHFPLYSTMNREFSKGVTLYLQEGARPQSTFAGHYDLAAYLVIVLPILFSFALSTLKINFKNLSKSLKLKTNYLSAFLHIIHIIGAWMLITSGSKTALFAYLVGIFIVVLQYLRKLGNIKQQLKWGSIALVITTIFLTLFLNFFAKSTKSQLITLVKNTFSNSQHLESPDAKPDDLIGDGVVFKQITVKDEFGNEERKWIKEQSTWSQNALKYGLSMGIRLDTLWPNALKGLANNPLFGNGYSTLAVVDTPGEYSNVDSTDNNYLRTLGETGIFGFLIFYGLIFIIAYDLFKQKQTKPILQALKIGFLGSIFGILINATYIDVFAASKVAYTFWTFAGITLATLSIDSISTIKNISKSIFKNWPLLLTIVLAFFMLHKNPFHKYALIRDLNVSNAQIESLVSANCFIETGSFTVCNSNGLILKNNTNIYSILLVPLLKIYNNPMMFYILNILLIILVVKVLYLILPKLIEKFYKTKPKEILIFSSLVLYIVIATALKYTLQPLTNLDLLIFLIIIPLLITIYTIIIHNIKYRLAYFTQVSVILIGLLFLTNQNYSSVFLNQFRNDIVSDKYLSLVISNLHFTTEKYLNRDKDYYLITTMNPYYVDFFSNNNYEVLPISESQPYFNQADQVYKLINNQTPLIEQYSNIIKDNYLLATNYGTNSNESLTESFNQLKDSFDLEYIAVGCDDNCNLYNVNTEQEKISPQPLVVNDENINIDNLNDSYSFSIISNRFEPKTKNDPQQNVGYNTTQFAGLLNSNIPLKNNFLILTGDATHNKDKKELTKFNSYFNGSPLIYTPGNFDLVDSKPLVAKDSYFYTDSEFFIFVNVNEKSQISEVQRTFIYNALLQIEKLPEIKNIFIVSHNLNWQDRSNPSNFIFELERKLNQFPELNKYIVTSHHSNQTDPELMRSELTIKHITDSSTNINYLSSYIRDWGNDSYFEFIINSDDSVTVDYKVKGENFQ